MKTHENQVPASATTQIKLTLGGLRERERKLRKLKQSYNRPTITKKPSSQTERPPATHYGTYETITIRWHFSRHLVTQKGM